jgi:hypothetical protein
MRRYGLSPRNYAKIRLVEEQANDLLAAMITGGTNEMAITMLEEAAENQNAIDALTTVAGDSMVAQQQVTTQAILNIADGITKLRQGVLRLSAWEAQKYIQDKEYQETLAQQGQIRKMQRENERQKRAVYQEWW